MKTTTITAEKQMIMEYIFYLCPMEITHDINEKKAWTVKDGHTAYVEYEIIEGAVDIIHTYVPQPLEGQGIASELVKFVYDYALKQGLRVSATCTYAARWLEKHPDYQ
jgi:predicted GNAT family acetyltransferase